MLLKLSSIFCSNPISFLVTNLSSFPLHESEYIFIIVLVSGVQLQIYPYSLYINLNIVIVMLFTGVLLKTNLHPLCISLFNVIKFLLLDNSFSSE